MEERKIKEMVQETGTSVRVSQTSWNVHAAAKVQQCLSKCFLILHERQELF